MDRQQRIAKLKSLFKERIVVMDGPRGTSILALDLPAQDFGGPEMRNIPVEGVEEALEKVV